MRLSLSAPRRLASALAAASLCATAAPRADVQIILPSGARGSSGLGLNDAGQVVGEYYDSAGYPRPFVWSAATGAQPLWSDPAWTGRASAINAQGEVAGTRSTSAFDSQAFVWNASSGLRLLGPGAAHAIDNAGRVGGGNGSATVWLPDGTARSLPGANGVVLALDGRGAAVGTSDNQASLWQADGTRTLIGNGTTGAAYGVSPQGQVVGLLNTAQGTRPFLWDSAGGTRQLPRLSERGAYASGINAGGQIIGQSQLADSRYAGVLWREGSAAQELMPLFGPGYFSVSPTAINAHAQITGQVAPLDTAQRAFLLTLHPDWSGGDGAWDDSTGQRWNWAGTGTAAARVGTMHAVVIDPGRSATVRGAAEGLARSLRVGGTSGSVVTLDLNGGSTRIGEVAGIDAGGVLRGHGRLEADHIVVYAGGRLQVDAGQAMQLGASTIGNGGQWRVQGTAAQPARLEVTGKGLLNDKGAAMQFVHADVQLDSGLDNAGQLSLQNAQLTLGAGKPLDNAGTGQLAFGFGGSLVNGRVYNEGLLVVSNGAQASFYGDVDNAGELRVSAGGAADFFGRVVSAGTIAGAGEIRFEGGLENKDPKLLRIAPDAWIGTGLVLGLGQRLAFDGAVTLEGAALSLSGSAAGAGAVYDLFDWNGTLQGRFDTLALPTLGAGLAWDTSDLYAGGTVSIAAIPEPGTWALWLGGAGLLAWRRRRARRRRTTLALLLAGLGWAGAQAQSLDQRHEAGSQSQICCGPNHIVTASGAGAVGAPNWFADAGADGSATFGHTSGSAFGRLAAPADAFGSGAATARDLFVDRITLHSDTLAPGTWVTVRAWVVLDASVLAEGAPGHGSIGRAMAAWHFGGPDAPWITGVSLERGEYAGAAGYGAASERLTGSADFQARIGDLLTMAGDSSFHASAGGVAATREASAGGSAWFYLDSDSAGVRFLGASGHDYIAPVPEPATGLLLMMGGATLLTALRRMEKRA